MKRFDELNTNDQQIALKQVKDHIFGFLIEGIVELDPRDFTRKKIDFMVEAAAEEAMYDKIDGYLKVIF